MVWHRITSFLRFKIALKINQWKTNSGNNGDWIHSAFHNRQQNSASVYILIKTTCSHNEIEVVVTISKFQLHVRGQFA